MGRCLPLLLPLCVACADDAAAPDVGGVADAAQRRDAAPTADATAVDRAAPADEGAAPDAQAVACLGTKYPEGSVIDPDNPDFEDVLNTKAEVIKKFATAKANNLPAYRAYKAALTYAHLLPCAFCPCGCDGSEAHVSAVDCFKDLHGFG